MPDLCARSKVGGRLDNPAMEISRQRIQPKKLCLPEPFQSGPLVQAIRDAKGRDSEGCGDFVGFLAYGGFRLPEARDITWADCNFDKSLIESAESGSDQSNFFCRR